MWTNSAVLRHEVEQPTWSLEYFNLAEATGLKSWSLDSPREVFALQEFEVFAPQQSRREKEKQKPPEPIRCTAKGDSSLYEGTMTLLKALVYETRSVQQRRGQVKYPLAYQFNLIQLLDGDLYEAAFGAGAPSVRKVERYRYFARTMLDGKELSARIEFCTRPAFEQLLQELSKVHEFNWRHFNAKVQTFYETVLTNPDRRKALIPEFAQRLAIYVSTIGEQERPSGSDWVRLEFNGSVLKVLLTLDATAVSRLRESNVFHSALARIAKELYRYSGLIEIAWDDLPF